jgi:acetyl-CoA synthetase
MGAEATTAFERARAALVEARTDYERARANFRWPVLDRFNWAWDWFDVIAHHNDKPALEIFDDETGSTWLSFAELADHSSRVASHLARLGIGRRDRVLIMLPNVAPLWELMLGVMKVGAVVIPATTQLTREDLVDRVTRGHVKLAVTDAASAAKLDGLAVKTLIVGAPATDDRAYVHALAAKPCHRPGEADETAASDPLLLYFTSGTTARPKLVLHTQESYPVGHLSTMYWIGLQEGDLHLNISSPGWAKHAWSCVFAPWNAGATVCVHGYARFAAASTLKLIAARKVATLCAPPTVWRMMVLEDLAAHRVGLREAVSAGEPLNPEVIAEVRRAWGLTVRDGYGQTETTALIGNSPGQDVVLGSMGRPLPGYEVALVDGEGRETDEGEIALRLQPRPVGLMVGYVDDPDRTAQCMAGGLYRTGDEARRDERGRYHYVGRGDDVFKSSDYRLSPFELESVLVEHPAVAEAAIVPSPDPVRTSVPKAVCTLRPGVEPSAVLAAEILAFVRERVAPYKRVRRIEFAELPKTISGKIRRVELRKMEAERAAGKAERPEHDYAGVEKGKEGVE